MGITLTNNAHTTLSADASSTDTTFYVEDIDSFPTLDVGDYFYCTIERTSGAMEIVKVTQINSSSFIVERGQENTIPISFPIGSLVELRMTVQNVTDLIVTGENVEDEAFGVSWNGDVDNAASRNALYDKFEAVATAIDAVDDGALHPADIGTTVQAWDNTLDALSGQLIDASSGEIMLGSASSGDFYWGIKIDNNAPAVGGYKWNLNGTDQWRANMNYAGTWFLYNPVAATTAISVSPSTNEASFPNASNARYYFKAYESAGGAAAFVLANNTAATDVRWGLLKNTTAESGSNAGSDLDLMTYTDGGSLNDRVFRVARNTAVMDFSYTPTVAGSAVLTAGAIGSTVQAYDANTAKLNVAHSWLANQFFSGSDANVVTFYRSGAAAKTRWIESTNNNYHGIRNNANTLTFDYNGTDYLTFSSSGAATFSYDATTKFNRASTPYLLELQIGGVARGYIGADATKDFIVYDSGGAEDFSINNSTGAATFAGNLTINKNDPALYLIDSSVGGSGLFYINESDAHRWGRTGVAYDMTLTNDTLAVGALNVSGMGTFGSAGIFLGGANNLATGIAIRSNAGYSRGLTFTTGASSARWYVEANSTAESGGNAGSDFIISNWDDAGAYIGSPLTITRSTGTTNISALAARVATSTETSGTLTSASANKQINATGNITFNPSVFTAGDRGEIYAGSSSRTITQGTSMTLRLDGTATTGDRTLAAYGRASWYAVAHNEIIVTGVT